jgi:hypothetical protein
MQRKLRPFEGNQVHRISPQQKKKSASDLLGRWRHSNRINSQIAQTSGRPMRRHAGRDLSRSLVAELATPATFVTPAMLLVLLMLTLAFALADKVTMAGGVRDSGARTVTTTGFAKCFRSGGDQEGEAKDGDEGVDEFVVHALIGT